MKEQSTQEEIIEMAVSFALSYGEKELAEKFKALASPVAQPQGYEAQRAIMEGERNAAAEDYFKARPQLDFIGNRRIFESGFQRGYEVRPASPVAQDEREGDFANFTRLQLIQYIEKLRSDIDGLLKRAATPAQDKQDTAGIRFIYVEDFAISPKGIVKALGDGDLSPEEATTWIEKLIRHNMQPTPLPAGSQDKQEAVDARRYRVLRDPAYQMMEDDPCVTDDSFNTFFGEDLDKAVDALEARNIAAMQAQGEQPK